MQRRQRIGRLGGYKWLIIVVIAVVLIGFDLLSDSVVICAPVSIGFIKLCKS